MDNIQKVLKVFKGSAERLRRLREVVLKADLSETYVVEVNKMIATYNEGRDETEIVPQITVDHEEGVIQLPVRLGGKVQSGLFSLQHFEPNQQMQICYGEEKIRDYTEKRCARKSIIVVGDFAQYVMELFGFRLSEYGFNIDLSRTRRKHLSISTTSYLKAFYDSVGRYIRISDKSKKWKNKFSSMNLQTFKSAMVSDDLYHYINSLVLYNAELTDEKPAIPECLQTPFFEAIVNGEFTINEENTGIHTLIYLLDGCTILPVEKNNEGRIECPGSMSSATINMALGDLADSSNAEFVDDGTGIALKTLNRPIGRGEQIIVNSYGREYDVTRASNMHEENNFSLIEDIVDNQKFCRFAAEQFRLGLRTMSSLKNIGFLRETGIARFISLVKALINPKNAKFNPLFNTEKFDELLKEMDLLPREMEMDRQKKRRAKIDTVELGQMLLLYTYGEWWPGIVVKINKKSVNIMCLRTDLAKDQLGYYGKTCSYKLGLNFTGMIATEGKTLPMVKNSLANATKTDKIPYCTLQSAIHYEPNDVPLKNVNVVDQQEFFKDMKNKTKAILDIVRGIPFTKPEGKEGEELRMYEKRWTHEKLNENNGAIFNLFSYGDYSPSPFNAFNIPHVVDDPPMDALSPIDSLLNTTTDEEDAVNALVALDNNPVWELSGPIHSEETEMEVNGKGGDGLFMASEPNELGQRGKDLKAYGEALKKNKAASKDSPTAFGRVKKKSLTVDTSSSSSSSKKRKESPTHLKEPKQKRSNSEDTDDEDEEMFVPFSKEINEVSGTSFYYNSRKLYVNGKQDHLALQDVKKAGGWVKAHVRVYLKTSSHRNCTTEGKHIYVEYKTYVSGKKSSSPKSRYIGHKVWKDEQKFLQEKKEGEKKKEIYDSLADMPSHLQNIVKGQMRKASPTSSSGSSSSRINTGDTDNVAKKIAEYWRLKTMGALTDEEYALLKAEVLKTIKERIV